MLKGDQGSYDMPSAERFERATLTVAEAGRLLGISRNLAYTLVAQGKLPTLRLGRRLVVPRLDSYATEGDPDDVTSSLPSLVWKRVVPKSVSGVRRAAE